MRKILICILAIMGFTTGCCQQNYENTDVEGFSKLVNNPEVTVLDVRTPQEYAEGHIEGALNIDVKDKGFIETAEKQLSPDKTIAVYCRSGKRSANAAGMLADKGFKVVNLYGGIIAWKDNGKPTTTNEDK